MSYSQCYPLVYTAEDSMSEASSGSACITERKAASSAELPCQRSPAARRALLQLDTQLKPQAEHHRLNPVLLRTGWESRTSPIFSSFRAAWVANTALAKLLSNRKELLADFMGDCVLKLHVHSLQYQEKTYQAVSVELVLLPLQVERADLPRKPPAMSTFCALGPN